MCNHLLFESSWRLGLKELTVPCMFKGNIIIMCYVDNSLVFAKYAGDIESPKGHMRKRFKVTDPGTPKQLSCIKFTRGQNETVLTYQNKLIANLLHVTGMKDAKAVGSQISVSVLSSPDHQKMLS